MKLETTLAGWFSACFKGQGKRITEEERRGWNPDVSVRFGTHNLTLTCVGGGAPS